MLGAGTARSASACERRSTFRKEIAVTLSVGIRLQLRESCIARFFYQLQRLSSCCLCVLLRPPARRRRTCVPFGSDCAVPCVFSNTRMQTKSDVEKMQESCVQILAISAVVVVVVELANYFLSYRSQTFRTTASKLVNAVCCVYLRFDFCWF